MSPYLRAVVVLCLLFFFMVGVMGLSTGFRMLGKDLLDSFFLATSNPFVALMVGILATSLVQSSSVTTAMIVALVAAPDNPLPIANAVPMIMGANIGTTVTNTIVSLAYMGRKEEFRRAFSVATCHDYFNFMAVAILLPLELMTGFMRHAATAAAGLIGEVGGYEFESPLKVVLGNTIKPLKGLAHALFESKVSQGVFLILVSVTLIYCMLMLLVKVMRGAVESRVELYVTKFLGSNVILAILIGVIITVMVQSSSVTTSLLVPLAGAGVITLRQAFPITLGANIGTTVTALLASMAASGINARAGLIIALVHLIFNVLGVAIIYPYEPIRRIPLNAARWFAGIAVESKLMAVIYIAFLFYGLPAICALINALLR